MRAGITVPKNEQLEYRGQKDPELSAKLAMIEASVLAHMRPQPVEEESLEGAALKRAIIERLKRL